MYRTNKFIAEVWKNDYETSLLKDGIVNYFTNKNQKIYFKYTNPFELLKLDAPKIANNFINSFSIDIQSTDYETMRAAYGIKYLSEELLINSSTAPICLYYSNNEYTLTKGNKKLQAAALINLMDHPTIIVTEETYIDDAYLIENDYHLYNILQMLDSLANTFYIRIEYSKVPTFHFLVNANHSSSWINQKKCHEFYQNNSLKFPLKIGLLGLASTDDKNINAIKLNNKIISVSGIDIIHSELEKQHLDYFCTVFSKKSINITAQYIEFVYINLFLESTIKFGYTHTLNNFSKNDILIKFNDGAISQIANY
jgi:hypothetical protein